MIKSKKLFVGLFVGVWGLGSTMAEWKAGRGGETSDTVPGEIIVRFKSGSSMGLRSDRFQSAVAGLSGVPADLQSLHQKTGMRRIRRLSRPVARGRRVSRSLENRLAARSTRAPRRVRERGPHLKDTLDRTAVLTFDSSRPLQEVLREYRANPSVEWVEPHYEATAFLVPTDPSYSSLWAMPKIKAPQAWDLQTGSGVVVAVVDSGVDYSHPDLAANMWVNTDEVPGNGIDDDANGFVDDVRGWDFAYDDSNPMDGHYHGTHVAGTVAAVANNGVGVTGVAFNAKIMAVKGLDDTGSGGYADLASAVIYAADNGADVINASWGGTMSDVTLSNAVAYAQSQGVVFVAAAGNSNADVSGFFPASYPGVIAVAATDSGDNRATFSNWGSRIDLSAPGVSIYSTKPGSSYGSLDGTSMASPHVAGVAALILSKTPTLSVTQVRDALLAAVDDIGAPGFDIYTGNGRINALKAVQGATPPGDSVPPSVAIVSPVSGATLSGSVSVTGTASDNAGVQTVEILVDGVLKGSAVGTTSWSYVLETTGYSNGVHTLSARATDISGLQTTTSVSLTINNVTGGNALYNATYRAPACLLPGAACDTGAISVLGRALISGGNEPNAPNTLQAGCADGTAGMFHSDESNDRLRVYSVDGSTLAAGKSVRVDATVWAYSSYTTDYLDIYQATDAAKAAWVPVATLRPTKAGAQILSTTYTLSSGTVQAVRANFRYNGVAGACTAGVFDDRDDLVFAVVSPTVDLTPPVVTVVAPVSGSLVRGSVSLSATASDNVGVARVQYALDDVPLGIELTTAPYSFAWNSLASLEGPHTLSARAWDVAGNTAKSGNVLVFVDNADTVISSVTVSSISTTTAVVSWKTNVITQLHEIEYGPTALYGSTVAFSTAFSTDPSRTLAGLPLGTTTHFRVKSRTVALEPWGVSGDQLFVTSGDGTPPVISGVFPSVIGTASAEIRWTTNEPADSQVEYGLTSAYGQLSSLKGTMETAHAVTLNGLSSGVMYHYRVRSRDSAGNLAVSPLDLVFTTLDNVLPVVSVTSPSDGAALSGSAFLTGSASDNISVTHVTLYIDGRLWKTIAGVGPASIGASGREEASAEATEATPLATPLAWSFSLDTTQLDNGSHTLRFEAGDGASNIGVSSRTVTSNNGSVIAVYDPLYKTPACGLPGAVCASGGRLEGRGIYAKFPEPNQPNTIQTSCGDGNVGTYHSDESLDWLKVSSLDGLPLAPGKGARVDAKGWVFSQTNNFLDLYMAADAQSPGWVRLTTLSSPGIRSQVYSTTFTVPVGGEYQAIRGLMRYGAGAGACVSGSYNDHDDLVYKISAAPGAPSTVRLSTGTSQTLVFTWGGATGKIDGYRIDASSSPSFTTFLPGFQDRNVGSALSWTIDGLLPLTPYYARVRAMNAGEASPQSPTAVGTTLGLPDLIVSSLTSKASVAPGEKFPVRLGIQNIGTWPTGVPVGWALLNHGTVIYTGGILPLGAGEIHTTDELSVTAPLVEGKYTVEARVNLDMSPGIPETNMTNNTKFIEYVVDVTSPTVTISTPTAESVVGGTVTVTAIATDNVAVTKVLFYVDGSLTFTDLAGPYQFGWNTGLVSTGTHTLMVVVYDLSNNTGTHSVVLSVRSAMTSMAANPPPVPAQDPFGLKEVLVFPSPIRGNTATVRILAGDAESLRLTVNSANGDRVRDVQVGAAPSLVNGRWVVETPLDVSDFSSGVYFLTVEVVKGGETQRKVSKFVVLR